MPLYSSLRCGGMSFAGVGRVQVGGDEKKIASCHEGALQTFFLEGSKSGRVRDDP